MVVPPFFSSSGFLVGHLGNTVLVSGTFPFAQQVLALPQAVIPLSFVHHEGHEGHEVKELKYESLDPLSQQLNVKVHQQPNSHLGEFHVGQNLRLVNLEQLIYAL